MSTNNINENNSKAIIDQGLKMEYGFTKVGAGIPMTMITGTKFSTDFTAFKNAEENFGIMRKDLDVAYGLFAVAEQGVTEFLAATRAVLVGHWGPRWSPMWPQAGWVTPSTEVPRKIGDRIVLAGAVISFLTKNHSYEVESVGVTAANGQALLDVALAARNDVADREQAVKDAAAMRDPLRKTLVADMRLVIKNLGLIAKDDPRWNTFGLNMPAARTTPGKPTGLTATYNPVTGGFDLSCDDLPLAERFRWRGREAGMPYQLMARSTSPYAKTKRVAPGTTLEFIVQGVNGGSQGVASDSIFATVPLAETPVAKTQAEPVVSFNGNGNGAEHTNGSRKAARV
jgi:hypothetical protein